MEKSSGFSQNLKAKPVGLQKMARKYHLILKKFAMNSL